MDSIDQFLADNYNNTMRRLTSARAKTLYRVIGIWSAINIFFPLLYGAWVSYKRVHFPMADMQTSNWVTLIVFALVQWLNYVIGRMHPKLRYFYATTIYGNSFVLLLASYISLPIFLATVRFWEWKLGWYLQ